MRFVILNFIMLIIALNANSQDSLLWDNELNIKVDKVDSFNVLFENDDYIFFFNKNQIQTILKQIRTAECDLISLLLNDKKDSIRFLFGQKSTDTLYDRYSIHFNNLLPMLFIASNFKIYDLKTKCFVSYKSFKYRCFKYNEFGCQGKKFDFRVDNDKIIFSGEKVEHCKEIEDNLLETEKYIKSLDSLKLKKQSK